MCIDCKGETRREEGVCVLFCIFYSYAFGVSKVSLCAETRVVLFLSLLFSLLLLLLRLTLSLSFTAKVSFDDDLKNFKKKQKKRGEKTSSSFTSSSSRRHKNLLSLSLFSRRVYPYRSRHVVTKIFSLSLFSLAVYTLTASFEDEERETEL